MDNRDAGESEPETAYYGLRDMAQDAVALLDALGMGQVHVLGHSLGASIALQVVLDHPTRVDHLVLLGAGLGREPRHQASKPLPPAADWWIDDPVERFRLWLPDILGPDYLAQMDEAAEAAIVELERGSRTSWAGMMRQEAATAGEVQLLSRLGEIRSPTLVLQGGTDFPDQAQALAAAIPGARFVVLSGVGHLPWVERPDATNRAILSFLMEAGGPVLPG